VRLGFSLELLNDETRVRSRMARMCDGLCLQTMRTTEHGWRFVRFLGEEHSFFNNSRAYDLYFAKLPGSILCCRPNGSVAPWFVRYGEDGLVKAADDVGLCDGELWLKRGR
jgi:hypothetical protein